MSTNSGFGFQNSITGVSQPDASGTSIYGPDEITDIVYEASDAIDVLGYSNVEFIVICTNAGSITELGMQIQFSELASPGSTDADWALIQTQVVASGVATLSDYTMEKDITAMAAPFRVGVSTPVRGRWMRFKITATAGTSTGSSIEVKAIRR